ERGRGAGRGVWVLRVGGSGPHLRGQGRRHRRLLGLQRVRAGDATGGHVHPGERGGGPRLRAAGGPHRRLLGPEIYRPGDPNRPPALGSIATHAGSGPLGRTVTATADFSDPDITDTHTALMDWGDGASSAAAVTETSGSGSAKATHSYGTPGVYTLTVTVTDSRGGAGVGTLRFLLLPGTTVPIGQTA